VCEKVGVTEIRTSGHVDTSRPESTPRGRMRYRHDSPDASWVERKRVSQQTQKGVPNEYRGKREKEKEESVLREE